MRSREISSGTLLFSAVLLTFAPLLSAEAQDVDVQGNLTMHDSADPTVGNVLKEGVPFLHNFGTDNTFLGRGAGNLTMRGDGNTAMGASALSSDDRGFWNTATGFNALFSNTQGSSNTAFGVSALFSNTEGHDNTAFGSFALNSNTTGFYNTSMGSGALYSNTTGFGNDAFGLESLFSNTTGQGNTGIGGVSLRSNTTGDLNTATGTSALYNNTTGNGNTASGVSALGNNTSGNFNTACGEDALIGNTTGSYNTAIGGQALSINRTGSDNTAIGFDANVLGELTNATVIGARATVDASNKIRFGNGQVTVIEGEVPYTYTSDRNRKENFRPIDADTVLTKLRGLSVASWNYKGQDAKQFRHYGPVAQDFFAAFGHDEVGTIGTPTTITSGDLDGILMVAAQALEKRTASQEERFTQEMNALRAENADLKARLEALERRVGGEVAVKTRAGF